MVNSTPMYLYVKSRIPFHFIKIRDYFVVNSEGIKSYYSECYIITCVNDTLKTIKKPLLTSMVDACECVQYVSSEFETAVISNKYI